MYVDKNKEFKQNVFYMIHLNDKKPYELQHKQYAHQISDVVFKLNMNITIYITRKWIPKSLISNNLT